MSFQIEALPAAAFSGLFGLSDSALADRGVLRVTADANPGFPCRVSLQDAAIGESLLLLNYEHQPAPTPYRSSHAIFVREYAATCLPAPDEIPPVLRRRLLSVRAFDDAGMMLEAEVVEGTALAPLIERMLADARVGYLHLHNARPGCYAARVAFYSP